MTGTSEIQRIIKYQYISIIYFNAYFIKLENIKVINKL